MTPLQVSRRAAERLRAGHLWVYRTDMELSALNDIEPGALVTLSDHRGVNLGTALWSSSSQIAARVISRETSIDREAYLSLVRQRLTAALHLRRLLAPVTEADNAHRLVFSEADHLPGIVADRYNDLVVLQLLIQATAQADVRAAIRAVFVEELVRHGVPLTVWERPDPRMRELEQLEAPPTDPLFTDAQGEPPTNTVFQLNGLSFGYDVAAGQKTGAFLDQRLNYAAAAVWAERLLRAHGRPGRALDVCTYQGGFALHLARVCAHVTGVDASRAALEAADRNLTLNAGLQAQAHGNGSVDWIEADAFELLRALDDAARDGKIVGAGHNRLAGRFDVVVLDPPAFAKSKRAAEGALRGYKELNLRALRLLEPGGLLVTCSCSHHVSAEDFHEAVRSAAVDAGRSVQLLESRGAAPDHPEVLALPETRYLKCLICRVA